MNGVKIAVAVTAAFAMNAVTVLDGYAALTQMRTGVRVNTGTKPKKGASEQTSERVPGAPSEAIQSEIILVPADPAEPVGPTAKAEEPIRKKPKKGERRLPNDYSLEIEFIGRTCPYQWTNFLTPVDRVHQRMIAGATLQDTEIFEVFGEITGSQFVASSDSGELNAKLERYEERPIKARFLCALDGKKMDLPNQYVIEIGRPNTYMLSVGVQGDHLLLARSTNWPTPELPKSLQLHLSESHKTIRPVDVVKTLHDY